jgi:hypothetical protein
MRSAVSLLVALPLQTPLDALYLRAELARAQGQQTRRETELLRVQNRAIRHHIRHWLRHPKPPTDDLIAEPRQPRQAKAA